MHFLDKLIPGPDKCTGRCTLKGNLQLQNLLILAKLKPTNQCPSSKTPTLLIGYCWKSEDLKTKLLCIPGIFNLVLFSDFVYILIVGPQTGAVPEKKLIMRNAFFYYVPLENVLTLGFCHTSCRERIVLLCAFPRVLSYDFYL